MLNFAATISNKILLCEKASVTAYNEIYSL